MRFLVPLLLLSLHATPIVPASGEDASAVAPRALPHPDGGYLVPLRGEPPAWLTPRLLDRVHAAGAAGRAFDLEKGTETTLALDLLFIRPGARMLYPSTCTMNFVYGSEGSYSIGSAGHCNAAGTQVVLLVAPSLLASIGTTTTSSAPGPDPETAIGHDYSLVTVAPQWQTYVDPNVADILGPQGGAYTGTPDVTAPVLLKHVGHPAPTAFLGALPLHPGTGGIPRLGHSNLMTERAFYFIGAAFTGDSGSPVLLAGDEANPLGQAVGILTHLWVYAPNSHILAGTRVTVVATPVDGDLDVRP